MPAAQPELTHIAVQLGIDIRTLRNWRKRDGFPENGDAAAVKAWAELSGLHRTYEKSSTAKLAELKAELMREQIALARTKNQRESGEVIDREVVEEMLGLLAQKLDLLLRLKLEVELGPRVAGKNAAEANVEGAAMLDEIREVIAGNIAKFQTEALRQQRETE